MKSNPYFAPHRKTNSKWIKTLNLRPEIIASPKVTRSKSTSLLVMIFLLMAQGKAMRQNINSWDVASS